MSIVRGSSSFVSKLVGRCEVEPLERRDLFAIARPDHIVIVIEQDRASDALGNPIWAYLNQIASTGLVYTNSHGVTHPSEPNTLAMYSGSTQGITDNGRNYSFSGANIARSLFNAGLSFSGYVENLPSDGSQVTQAGDGVYPDLYTRNINGMAQFTDIGIDPATGQPRANAKVNRTFAAFTAFPKTDYSTLPTVSFIIPNNLHNAHGSNEMEPWAGSPDEENNDILRKAADDWLRSNLDAYLQWAKQNNSLLIVTQDEERWTGGNSPTITTVVNGDADLFNPGTNSDNINHYNLLHTITNMYGVSPLGVTGSYAQLDVDAMGQLSPDASQPPVGQVGTTTAIASSSTSSVFGQLVTFTATVSPASGSLVPDGIVTFKDGTTTIGTGTLNASGVAGLALSNLAVGTHAITATYGGSASFNASTSSMLAQAVSKAAAHASVTSSANPSAPGQAVTFKAVVSSAVSGAAAPTGTVQFKIDGIDYGSPVTLVNGVATSPANNSLTLGSYAITAVYSGSANHTGATSPALSQVVSAGAPANNNFANRFPLTGDAIVTTASTVLATKESREPSHAGNRGGKSVWWSWIAPAAGTVTIDTAGSNFDTLLAVYTGTSLSSLSKVASNDDASGTQTSKVTFTAVAGRTYQIAIDGYNGASGNATLRVFMNAKTPTGVAASDGTLSDRVRVTWSAAVGATAYEIWRAPTNSTSAAVKLGEATTPSFDDLTATAGQTYWYFVRAKNPVSTSGFSTGNSGYLPVAAATAAAANSSLLTFSTTRIVLGDIVTR